MPQRLYSVEQVAELLGLHVRTVRGYVRDGRLKAARIGKQYRIAREDLESFTGAPVSPPAREPLHAEASATVRIDGVDPETASRLATLLTASAGSRDHDGRDLHVKVVHDAERAVLRIVVLGGPGDTSALLGLAAALVEEQR
ncbi:helix-turn-helix domain-containing protein [Actinorugispora endophytica]|uniref:Excisionase family DNA binding protein n=1 Tax=Actinorugispora endophytica TaxID=1605990 RepID=A0A4R6V2N4_9ACTN|nr:helix-turn-helix domain-containing protein [Actinorugispora endophytica]TDQ54233.1 excisionase family DNA binding protein [Actinorugispora endophytica]